MKAFVYFSLCLFLVSCATDTTTKLEPTKTQSAVPKKTSGTTPEIIKGLNQLVPSFRGCIDPYVKLIPKDEMVELRLDFDIDLVGRVIASRWNYADFSDALPTHLKGCLNSVLARKRFVAPQKNGLHRVSLPVKFYGYRK